MLKILWQSEKLLLIALADGVGKFLAGGIGQGNGLANISAKLFALGLSCKEYKISK